MTSRSAAGKKPANPGFIGITLRMFCLLQLATAPIELIFNTSLPQNIYFLYAVFCMI
jgi:hypothetical protein